jgi:beta-lactamase superfamily II metal-dependent hydrolase
MSRIVVLDVGHGNCAVVLDGTQTGVVDAPLGSLLLDTLDDLGIDTVHAAFVSHTDKDHLAGILSLLTSAHVKVEAVYVNPDAQKRSKLWRDFRAAVSVAERKGGCNVVTSLSSTTPGTIQIGETVIKVVAPSASLALTGVGGMAKDGRTITGNSLSAVLLVHRPGTAGILFAGDIDEVGLDDVLEHEADLRAEILVFPHHGGLPGSNSVVEFASKLLSRVQPNSVIFSNGRKRYDNPHPEIVEQALISGCSVACTQLSERCHGKVPEEELAHLETLRAQGRKARASCAGSMTIELEGGAHRLRDAADAHADYVASAVPTPMCRRRNAV